MLACFDGMHLEQGIILCIDLFRGHEVPAQNLSLPNFLEEIYFVNEFNERSSPNFKSYKVNKISKLNQPKPRKIQWTNLCVVA